MKYRNFPGTDISVSEVGFGTWTLATGRWGNPTDAEAVALLNRAFDQHGVNFFDAADSYGGGRAEDQLARAFRGSRREEVVIGTKVGHDMHGPTASAAARRGEDALPQRFDEEFIRHAVEQSLRRLKTDRIDVLQLHHVGMEQVRAPELWELLRTLVLEGKVRAWGAAFGPENGWLDEAALLCEREPDIHTIQIIWNLLEQSPGSEIIAAAREAAPHCRFNVRLTHASGLLEGNLTGETVFPPGDHRAHHPRSWLLNGLAKVDTLGFLTDDMTLAQAALKWVLAEPMVASALPDIASAAQLAEFTAASDLRDLDPEQLERVAELAADNFGVEERTAERVGANERAAG